MKRTDVERGGTIRGRIGEGAGPPPPEGAERFAFVVEDPEGMGCETAVWILRALHRLDASVWVEHRAAGSLQIAERGRGTPGRRMLWTRFYQGEELSVAATGPEAGGALEACREMVAVPPEERKALYRERYSGRTQRLTCKVCEHPDREMVDEALEGGASPRSLKAHYPDFSRVELTAHRDGCMVTTDGEER